MFDFNLKKLAVLVGVILAVAALYLLFFNRNVFAINTPAFTVCHHTPGNQVTLNFQNIQSYLGHLGTPHSGQTYDTPGACVDPTPTPTPSPTPTVTPTVTPSPTPDPCHPQELEIKLAVVDIVQEPCPTPTPPPPADNPGNPSSDNKPGEYHANVCSVEPPKAAILYGFEYISPTEVKFMWHPSTDPHTKQAILYGYSEFDLPYGIDNLPNDAFEVNLKELNTPHSQVWAQIVTFNGECASYSNRLDP